MTDIISSALNGGCIQWVYEGTRFITCAYWNMKKLEKNIEELTTARNDVIIIINNQKQMQPGTECKVVVTSWLVRVNSKEKEVNGFLERSSSTCCFAACNGIKLLELINQVHVLVEERNRFDDANLVEPFPIDAVHNVPDLESDMVGRNLKLSEIHGYLSDNQVKTIGICGPGGIGKTTMLKKIKDELISKHYDFIVWIMILSQNDVGIVGIQTQIARCISLTLNSEDETERATILRNVLRPKKSLILIDNVWNKLDFEKIGIPFGVDIDNVKIVLTTRSERVCIDTRTQKIVKLDFLNEEESRQLFKKNISSAVDLKNDQIVSQRVDEILKRCGGLPLVIVTVAKTVADYTYVEQWDDAVDCLQNSPAEMEGMDEVLQRLKFSYDKLENDEIRSCLMYFSLYPVGDSILIPEIIRNWIGEGFLDVPNKNSFEKSYIKGLGFVNKLKSFCLVESGISDHSVKVHDVIRDMLCWIGKKKREVLLVYNKDQDLVSNDYEDWNLAKGIYLNERKLQCLPHENCMPSSCPNLTTLIVQANYSHRIVKLPTEDFFRFTTSLRVLDLSGTGLEDIPKSIGELGELRYLNLFHTPIKMLPKELGNLKKLTRLDLGDTFFLESIPNISISQLSQLQSLNLYNTKYQWNSDIINATEHRSLTLEDLGDAFFLESSPNISISISISKYRCNSEIINATEHRSLTLEDLRELKNLEDLGVDVLSNFHLNTILASHQKLLKSMKRIRFFNIHFTAEEGQPIMLVSERFTPLKLLIVDRCALPGNILEIKYVHQLKVDRLNLWNLEISSVMIVKDCPFPSLQYLHISNCRCLKEVSWTAHLPFLQELNVEDCHSIEEFAATGEEEIEEERDCYFPNLRNLMVSRLKNLQRIHGRSRPLPFPALRRIRIEDCPKLKELSLGRDSAKDMKLIRCKQSQWDLLEWEDDQVKEKFSPFFRVPL